MNLNPLISETLTSWINILPLVGLDSVLQSFAQWATRQNVKNLDEDPLRFFTANFAHPNLLCVPREIRSNSRKVTFRRARWSPLMFALSNEGGEEEERHPNCTSFCLCRRETSTSYLFSFISSSVFFFFIFFCISSFLLFLRFFCSIWFRL